MNRVIRSRPAQRNLAVALILVALQALPVSLDGPFAMGTAAAASGNTWTAIADSDPVTMPQTVVLPDGRVLILGGTGLPTFAVATIMPIPEIWDPATGQWTHTSTPPWAPDVLEGQIAVGLTDGTVLVAGGLKSGSSGYVSTASYIFDPAAPNGGSWTATGSMTEATAAAGAALMSDGRVIVVGGAPFLPSVEAFDPDAGTWSDLAPYPYPTQSPLFQPLVLALPGGGVFASGGYESYLDGPIHNPTAYIYDPEADAWTFVPAYVGSMGQAGVVLPDGRVLLAGGADASFSSRTANRRVYIVNPATLEVTEPAWMSRARTGHALRLLSNGLVLAVGGVGPYPTTSAEVWDPAGNRWLPAASTLADHYLPGSALLHDGRLLIVSGHYLEGWSEVYAPGDFVPPVVGAPVAWFRTGVTAGSALPMQLRWSAVDGGGSGFSMDLERSVNGGSWTRILTSTSSKVFNLSLTAGKTYRYRVRGHDGGGNTTAWMTGPTLKPGLTQQTSSAITYKGTWTTTSSSSYSGGTARYATAAGANATFVFTGRAVSLVTRRGPGRGAVKVYLDGKYVTTIDLRASSTTYRYVAFSKTWSTSASHKIKLVNVGTSGRPRIELDAFEVVH